MKPKQFRTEVGREIKRMRKLQKERWSNGRRYYLRVLRTTYYMLGITPEKLAMMNPKLRAETMIYIKGIVGWTNFLLTIQPNPPKHTKFVIPLDVHTSEGSQSSSLKETPK